MRSCFEKGQSLFADSPKIAENKLSSSKHRVKVALRTWKMCSRSQCEMSTTCLLLVVASISRMICIHLLRTCGWSAKVNNVPGPAVPSRNCYPFTSVGCADYVPGVG